MKLTAEDFATWRHSRVSEYIFDTLLAKHAVDIRQHGMDAAWQGDVSEDFMTSCRAEYKILTQLTAMGYEDFVAISEADKDDE